MAKDIKTKQVHIKQKQYEKSKTLDINVRKKSKPTESSETQSPENTAQETIMDTYIDNSKTLAKNLYRLKKNKSALKNSRRKNKTEVIEVPSEPNTQPTIPKQIAVNTVKQVTHLAESESDFRTYHNAKENSKGVAKIVSVLKNLAKGTVKLFKVTSNTLLYLSAFIIPVLVVVSGIFIIGALFAPSKPSIEELRPLSAEVESYRGLVQQHAEEQGIGEYTDLLLAIMMQESNGIGDDPMQSSECEFNMDYPQRPNGITDPEYSIKTGVLYFKECLGLSLTDYPDDMEHIYLALQGYNYGKEYISWAVQNFGGYSYFNAIAFSEQKKEELQTSVYGDPEYVSHVLRYYKLS